MTVKHYISVYCRLLVYVKKNYGQLSTGMVLVL